MSYMREQARSEKILTPSLDLSKALARYGEPHHIRSLFELIVTSVLFIVFWVAAWWALSVSYWLTLALSIAPGALLARLFLIKHDCGHGAFFRQRYFNDWVGRVLGVMTLTPYYVWRRNHAVHHATSGNLDKRGTGDIDTLTVSEYQALPRLRRIAYQLYRHPLLMFVVGPAYHFLLRNRLPLGFANADRRFWISAMGTNAAIALVGGFMIYFLGAVPFLLVHLPITLLAATIGVWLFYVQHQFEDTVWANDYAWNLYDTAFFGSSHYELPTVLNWITANIGVHHVHHLNSRIPYYRLPQVLRDIPSFTKNRRLTLRQSFVCMKLRLWDEDQQKLVSFAEARELKVDATRAMK